MHLTLLLLLSLIGLSLQQCDPIVCRIPNCRCYFDRTIPGGLSKYETPQIVMISFEGTINHENIKTYLPLFNGVNNPNNCPARGTFFIEDSGTEYQLVKDLDSNGHEIGIMSVDGTNPTTSSEWTNMLKKVSSELEGNNIDMKEVKGVRAPQLEMGGNEEMIGIGSTNLLYDTSCSNVSFSNENTFLWPYTFDFMPTAGCDNGKTPSLPFPGMWEVPIADLHDISGDKLPCAAPSGCRNITTKRDAFDLFYSAFAHHYNDNRAPFLMIIDPTWASYQYKLDGTVDFLQYIRSAFRDDVWIVPVLKALEWIQKPVPISALKDFIPWQC